MQQHHQWCHILECDYTQVVKNTCNLGGTEVISGLMPETARPFLSQTLFSICLQMKLGADVVAARHIHVKHMNSCVGAHPEHQYR